METEDEWRRNRIEEIQRLRDGMSIQSSEISALQTKSRTLAMSLSEAQEANLSYELNIARSNREKELLENRIKSLEEQLHQKCIEGMEARSSHTRSYLDLENQLALTRGELEHSKMKYVLLQDRLNSQEEKMDECLRQLDAAEANTISLRANFNAEMEGLLNMKDLYKHHFEDANNKVASLEDRIAHDRQIYNSQLEEICTKIIAEANEALNAQRTESNARIKLLEEQLQERIKNDNLSADGTDGGGGGGGATRSTNIFFRINNDDEESGGDDIGNLNIYQMHERLTLTERLYAEEKKKNSDMILHFQAALKEQLEQNSPSLERLMDAYETSDKKCQELGMENVALKRRLRESLSDLSKTKEMYEKLDLSCNDLSKQVQYLVFKTSSSSSSSSSSSTPSSTSSSSVALISFDQDDNKITTSSDDVITNRLVTFEDVVSLQTRNAQLLKALRAISKEQESSSPSGNNAEDVVYVDTSRGSKNDGSADDSDVTLSAVLEELANMKDARKRAEDMVQTLLQQRDMYRDILHGNTNNNDDASSSSSSSASLALPTHSISLVNFDNGPFSAPISTANANLNMGNSRMMSPSKMNEFRAKISQLEGENNRLKEQEGRLKQVENLLTTNLEKVKADCIELQLNISKANAEVQACQRKQQRADVTAKSLEGELTASNSRYSEALLKIQQQQAEIRLLTEKLVRSDEKLTYAEHSVLHLRKESDILRDSERKLIEKVISLNAQANKHGMLGESVEKLAAEIKGGDIEATEVLKSEILSLSKELSEEKRNFEEKVLLYEQQKRTLESALTAARAKEEERSHETSSLKEELTREQSGRRAAEERSQLMERQLFVAQQQLHVLLPPSSNPLMADSLLSQEVMKREEKLERLELLVQQLTQQLNDANAYAENFKKLSVNAESRLKEATTAAANAEKLSEEKVQSIRAEMNALEAKVASLESDLASRNRKITELETLSTNKATEWAEKESLLKNEMEAEKASHAQLLANVEILKGELLRLQTTARAAYENYEKEKLSREAQSKEMVELQSQLMEVKSLKESLTQELIHLQSLHSLTKSLEDETTVAGGGGTASNASAVDTTSSNHHETESELRRVNDILLRQVQSLGLQLERLTSIPHSTTPSILDENLKGGHFVSSKGSGENEHEDDEHPPSLSSSAELVEVIRYMKRERDGLEASLTHSLMEASTLKGKLAAAKKAAEEAKAELKREVDASLSRSHTHTPADFERLLAEVGNTNMLRESNARLHAENSHLKEAVNVATNECSEIKRNVQPLQEQIKTLQGEKASLEAQVDSLSKSFQQQQDRMSQLMSKYSAVDPHDYKLLVDELNSAKDTISSLEQQMNEEKKTTDEASAAQQARYDELEKNASKLRNKLKEKLGELEGCKGELGEVRTKLASLTNEVEDLVLQKSDLQKMHDELLVEREHDREEFEKRKEEAVSAAVAETKALAATAATAAAAAAPANPNSNNNNNNTSESSTQPKVAETTPASPVRATPTTVLKKRKDSVADDVPGPGLGSGSGLGLGLGSTTAVGAQSAQQQEEEEKSIRDKLIQMKTKKRPATETPSVPASSSAATTLPPSSSSSSSTSSLSAPVTKKVKATVGDEGGSTSTSISTSNVLSFGGGTSGFGQIPSSSTTAAGIIKQPSRGPFSSQPTTVLPSSSSSTSSSSSSSSSSSFLNPSAPTFTPSTSSSSLGIASIAPSKDPINLSTNPFALAAASTSATAPTSTISSIGLKGAPIKPTSAMSVEEKESFKTTRALRFGLLSKPTPSSSSSSSTSSIASAAATSAAGKDDDSGGTDDSDGEK